MKADRIFGMLSLCRRAGRLCIGMEPVLEAAAKGETRLVLTAADLSPRSRERLLCRLNAMEASPRVATLPQTMEDLSQITHRLTGICAVCDEGFAKGIETLMTDDEEEICS